MTKRYFEPILFYSLLAVAVLLTLLPVVWMVSTSFKLPDQVFTYPIEWLPRQLHWQNYAAAFQARPFGLYLLNSIIQSTVSMVIAVLLCAAAGYSFAQHQLVCQAMSLRKLEEVDQPFLQEIHCPR